MSSSATLTSNTQLEKIVSYDDLLLLGDQLEEASRDPTSDNWNQPTTVCYLPPPYPPPQNHPAVIVHNPAEMGYFNGNPYYQQLAPHQDLVQNIGYRYVENAIAGASSPPAYNYPRWGNACFDSSHSGSSSSVSPTDSGFDFNCASSSSPLSGSSSPALLPLFRCLIPGCNAGVSEAGISGHVTGHYKNTELARVDCQVLGCSKPGPYKISGIARHVKNHYAENLLGEDSTICGKRLSRGDSLRRHYWLKHKIQMSMAARGRKPETAPKKFVSRMAAATAVAEVLPTAMPQMHRPWKRSYIYSTSKKH